MNFENYARSCIKRESSKREKQYFFNKDEYSPQYELTYLTSRFMKLSAKRIVTGFGEDRAKASKKRGIRTTKKTRWGLKNHGYRRNTTQKK